MDDIEEKLEAFTKAVEGFKGAGTAEAKEVFKAYTVPRFPVDETFIKAASPGHSRAISFDNDKQRNAANLNKGLAKPGYISYETLRRAAKSVHVTRICITVLKEKVTKTEWTVKPKDPMTDAKSLEGRIDTVSRLLAKPNRNGDTWRSFIDKSVEDLLVLDAVAWEKTRYPDGELAELYQVDASTIHPVYNEYGEQDIPIPLNTENGEEVLPVSFLQVLNYSQYGGPESGDITAAWPRSDMDYFHMHPQSSLDGFGFGLSPIESVLSVVTNLLNADNFNGTYFEEGSFPPVILQLVGQVNERDLEAYREYLISELMGRFHRPAILAGQAEAKVINLKDLSQRDMQFMEYTLFLAKLMAAAYGLQPQDIGLTDDVGGKSVADNQKQLSQEKGYSSILNLLKERVNLLITEDFGFDDVEFDWVADDSQLETDMATITDVRLKNGSMTLNEVRQKFGDRPLGEWANQPAVFNGSSYTVLGPQSFMEPVQVEEDQQEGENGPKGGEEGKDNKTPKKTEKSLQKAVLTRSFRVWMDDRGYSQPFIFSDILTGQGFVIKPPVAVNLMSQELEVALSREIESTGVNVPPVHKATFAQVLEMLPDEVRPEFDKYVAMASEFDSEKWRSKLGGSRKFAYYLVQPYVDGYQLTNPLLIADMKRDPRSYEQAVKDLAELWMVEKRMLLGDRRADQYVVTREKRGVGFDYQFAHDRERYDRTKDALPDAIKQVPELWAVFRAETSGPRKAAKAVRRLFGFARGAD